jgi:hypothetical protein
LYVEVTEARAGRGGGEERDDEEVMVVAVLVCVL